ncbi:unnamed protein product [marine sediment metagenome]|uniref:Uncharacterized protein n=1 Tax=marine sediment metagenome TaxID=412755 RepID=X1UD56_9ZZZZ
MFNVVRQSRNNVCHWYCKPLPLNNCLKPDADIPALNALGINSLAAARLNPRDISGMTESFQYLSTIRFAL